MLKIGHVVELVTNLTLENRISELLDAPKEDLRRLIVKGSLHYIELVKHGLLDTYFANMKKLLENGVSSYPFIVVGDEYLPYLEEIKDKCTKEIGHPPHLTTKVDYAKELNTFPTFYLEKLEHKGRLNEFDSKIFDCFKYFARINSAKHFCYAGEWSFVLDTKMGGVWKCHYAPTEQNIFEDISKPIKFEPIGHNCCVFSCALIMDLLSMGITPNFDTRPDYYEILYKEGLINPELKEYLSGKFSQIYGEHSWLKKLYFDCKFKSRAAYWKTRGFLGRSFLGRIYRKLKK